MATQNPCALLDRLIAEGREKPWLEFKHNNSSPDEIGENIAALANSALLHGKEKAYLVFGVENGTLRKLGTAFKPSGTKKGNEGLENWLTRKLDPQVHAAFHEFTCEGMEFSIIEIEPSYHRPVRFDGEAYIRIGEHKKRLLDHPEHERSLWLATGRRKFENAVALSNLEGNDVLHLLHWQTYFKLAELPQPESEAEILRRLIKEKFISDEFDGTFAVNNLGALLLARNISDFPSVSRKTVRVTHYLGNDSQTALGEIEGQYGYAVGFEGLINFVVSKASKREKLTSGIRQNISIIPELAIREIIANALIHQDLSASGSGPIVEIYDNRIEVSNPGGPLGEIDRLIDDAPRSRNEMLAKSMRLLGLCEERGKGLDNVIASIETVASEDRILLSAPWFRAAQNGLIVTLFGPKKYNQLSREERLRICFQHCVLAYLRTDYMNNSSLRERLSLLKDDYQIASAVIADAVKSNLIVPADKDQGKRNARYIPYWATP